MMKMVQKIMKTNRVSNFQLVGKPDDLKVKTVLGINWDLTSDVFIFDFKDIIEMGERIKMTN